MRDDSAEMAQARADLDAAVRAFVRVFAREHGVSDAPVVMGWAGFAEYNSVELQERSSTGNCILVPTDQATGMSRGLMEFGTEAFSRLWR